MNPANAPTDVDYLRCVAVQVCIASGLPSAAYHQHYLLRYVGATWTALDAIPNAGATSPRVDCATLTACRSVTDVDYSRAWTASGGFGPAVELGDRLYHAVAVSCVASVAFCAGVNAGGDVGVWNNGTWEPAVRVDRSAAPTAISCVPSGDCVLVDDAGNAVHTADTGAPSAPTHIDSRPLTGISCTSADFCEAIDDSGYVVRYEDGSWHTPTLRSPVGLRGISCTSTSFCLAVGHGYMARYAGGGRWAAAKRVAAYAGLVSCTSSSYCVVGIRDAVRFWGGKALSPPFALSTLKDITALSCATPAFCNLVYHPVPSQQYYLTFDGAAYAGSKPTPVAEHLSCWAPRQCLLLDDGDHAYVTQ